MCVCVKVVISEHQTNIIYGKFDFTPLIMNNNLISWNTFLETVTLFLFDCWEVNSTSRRGFLRLSRVLPTSRVFTSGYANTETILHFFSVNILILVDKK